MKKIIIVGYPKSGNTWISRLTAELVNCPVDGFLYSNHEEIAQEGSDRTSEYILYKSHHQLHELTEEDAKFAKLIYVIRDPRDISLSGRSFFLSSANIFRSIDFSKKGFIHRTVNTLKAAINVAFHKSLGKKMMKSRMNKALLHGNEDIHHWCRVSWKTHMAPYLKKTDVLKVKYESALKNPMKESKRILGFIGIEKDEHEIQKSIDNQSFAKRKQQFLKNNQTGKAKFLRKGKGQQWKNAFSEKENQIFIDSLKAELQEFGYDLEK